MDNILKIMKEGLSEDLLLEFISLPSKYIRSRVSELYIKTTGHDISLDVLNIFASGEIIHNASLLHDDIIDDAEFRRGKTTIGVKYSPKISILAGDYLVGHAIEKLLKIDNKEIFVLFNNCIKTMCETEIQQYFKRGKMPSKDEYIKTCKGKTAVLFSAILESSAILTGIDRNLAKQFGESFGIYFQIKNDLEEWSAKADIKNKIYTAKEVLGIENTLLLLDNLREEMRSILGNFPNSDYKRELEELFKS